MLLNVPGNCDIFSQIVHDCDIFSQIVHDAW